MDSMLLPWKNKKCVFLGDSITQGIGTTDGHVYWNYLQALTGIQPYSYGQNGAKTRQAIVQAQTMYQDMKDQADAIFIMTGTNDFYGNIPLGAWYDETEETVVINSSTGETQLRKKRSFIENTDTMRGSLNQLLHYLKSHCPTKQVILMTPLHRAYAKFGDANIQYNELYANGIGLYFEAYVDTVRQAARIWSTPLIDLYAASGICPLVKEHELYFNYPDHDRLHPNELGHERIANTIAAQLLAISSFDRA